jgi:hypothetical protein
MMNGCEYKVWEPPTVNQELANHRLEISQSKQRLGKQTLLDKT